MDIETEHDWLPKDLSVGLVVDHGRDLYEHATAVFDPQRRYRYLLTRTWSAAPPLTMCMLNPSTADAFTVDATISRCLRLARRERAGGLVVVNLFAWRATRRSELRKVADPVGPHSAAVLEHVFSTAGDLVVAWGVDGNLHGRGDAVRDQLAAARTRTRCLGTTQAGEPRHPLFVRAAAQLVSYPQRSLIPATNEGT